MSLVVRYRCECGVEIGYDDQSPDFPAFMAKADEDMIKRPGEMKLTHRDLGETHFLHVLPAPRLS